MRQEGADGRSSPKQERDKKYTIKVKEGIFVYSVFRNLAIIILSAKFFGLVARKCKAPQVVGEILAGLLLGPCILNLVQTSDTISCL